MLTLLLAPLVFSAEASSMPLPVVTEAAYGLVCENGVCYRTTPIPASAAPLTMPGPGLTVRTTTVTATSSTTVTAGEGRRFRPFQRLLALIQNRPRLFARGCN